MTSLGIILIIASIAMFFIVPFFKARPATAKGGIISTIGTIINKFTNKMIASILGIGITLVILPFFYFFGPNQVINIS